MKRLFFVMYFVILLILSACGRQIVFAEDNKDIEAFEVMQIDSAIHGILKLEAVSDDLGKSIIKGYGENLCRVFATKVVFADNTIITVKQVKQIKSKGVIYNVISFNEFDNFCWVISMPKTSMCLIQLVDSDGVEFKRILCQIYR